MNRMHYGASAVGAQEFIFGVEALRARSAEANYPFLSSNLRLKSSGGSPDFSSSSTVVDVNGMKVGIVGLTPLNTPERNAPQKTEDFDFLPYLDVLDQSISTARSSGADVVVVLTSLCHDELLPLIPTASQAGVAMIGGAYCGQTVATVESGVAIVVPKPYFGGYGKATFKVNKGSNTFSNLTVEAKVNSGGSMDEEVQGTIETWGSTLESELGQVIGYASAPVSNKSVPLYNLVMDSWLFAFPEADMAHLNDGAIRQGIPEGDIAKGLFIGMMPFQNMIIELELTGAEVVDCLQPSTIMAGMRSAGGFFHSDGSPLKMDSVYHVLTTDFLYGQAGYNYNQYDSDPLFLGMTYDQPTLLYVEALATSPADPLNNYLDPTARR
jgi:2',3'-cyclic-nucleotide 2'-phosphodiesterase (5'-nucleotidase family)